MEDITKLKDDLKIYAKRHQDFIKIVELLNQHKIRLSKKLQFMEEKGFKDSTNDNEKETYVLTLESYEALRDVVTDSSKSLIFIDEFIDRIKNEENIIKEEIIALKSCMELINKAEHFEKVIRQL